MSDDAPIEIECPECQKRLRAPAKAAGKRIRCPACSHVISVPGETSETAVAPKPLPKPVPPPLEPEAHDEPPPDDDEDDREDRPRRRRRSASAGYDDDDDDRSRNDDEDFREIRSLRRRPRPAGAGFMAAAICLLVVASLGLVVDLFGSVFAIAAPPQPVDPNAPPFMQELTKNMHGPQAIVGQGIFALVSGFIIIGSIQMLRRKTWGLGLAACILSMVNIGNCCCFLGLPVGIWAMVMLLNPDVKDGFT